VLDLDPNRAAVPPREAATLLLVRDGDSSLEIFCVVRHAKSGFLGGAVVFPGGKVDATDRDAAWSPRVNEAPRFVPDEDEASARAFAVAACREALEEAAILLTTGDPLLHEDVLLLRSHVGTNAVPFRDALAERDLTLDLASLHAFGRWVTPVAESRRFDTRFFLACAPRGQQGAHDAYETTASFWASPRAVLDRFDRGELQLAPPTHRCLELLAGASSTREAIELAARLGLLPVCPKLVPVPEGAGTLALVLPGDPEHDVSESRVPGSSRFVLRGERWVPS
jgi:8-oxo-dGTP pyrophosphatase MutT (NUDIX family)